MKTKIKQYISVCAIALSIVLCLFCIGRAALPSISAAEAATGITDARLQQYADDVAALVNQEREAEGMSPLYMVPVINQAAADRAAECAESFSHLRPDGSSCGTVLDDYNISWFYRGENIAYGYRTPEAVMNGWMNSTGHRGNILDSDFTHIGVGVAEVDGVLYWAQIFVGGTDSTNGAYLPKLSETTTSAAITTTTTTVTTTMSTTTTATTIATTAATTTATEETTISTEYTGTNAEETTAGTTSTTITRSSAEVLVGDITLDGVVDLIDVIILNKYCSDAVTLSEQALSNADCTADGNIDMNDSLVLLRFLVHIVHTLPCTE